MTTGPIDAVVTWVDGDDPVLREKRAQYAPLAGKTGGHEATRFASKDEISHCLRSLLRFAPWFRMIHVVTDGQVPQVVEQLWSQDPSLKARLRIVDHQEIFRDHLEFLPSFNSLAIETMLYRIQGLADRFVVFNDDFMLLRPVREADFFSQNGPVLRGRWMSQALRFLPPVYHLIDRLRGRADQRFSFKQVQLRSARLAGVKRRFLCSGHTPYPVRTATIAEFFARFPNLLSENAAMRFRHPDQFHMMVLANHLELKAGQGRVNLGAEEVFIRADVDKPQRVREKLQRAATDEQAKFLCVGSLDMAEAQTGRDIAVWLQSRETV